MHVQSMRKGLGGRARLSAPFPRTLCSHAGVDNVINARGCWVFSPSPALSPPIPRSPYCHLPSLP